jgi:hypothetical protein
MHSEPSAPHCEIADPRGNLPAAAITAASISRRIMAEIARLCQQPAEVTVP